MTLNQIKVHQLNDILSSLDSWFHKWSVIDRNRTAFLDKEDPQVLYDVRSEIAESWIRSKKNGIFPQSKISNKMVLSRPQFNKVVKDNSFLLQTAEPILKEAAAFFSRINSFGIGLLDNNAILLSLYNFPFKQLQPGLDFSEEKVGTSAVSISLAQNKPAYLLGAEIYNNVLRSSKFIVSIPIHDMEGNISSFLVAPYFQRLQITEAQKKQLLWLVSWQFSLAQRIEDALHDNSRKLYLPANNHYGEHEKPKKEKHLQAIYTFANIIGNSSIMLKTKEIARRVARTPGNILLSGESGTGKELFAHAIHNECSSHSPFVAINCGAIPENLIESELFGYEGGSFTGAERKGKIGKMEMANGGTLFLDEIGDMPLELQPVLLRVLEDKRIMKVGGNRYIPVNFRIIAATNKDLYQMVQEGKFREDLYFRLAALKIQIPPLRDRGTDIIDLAYLFIKKTCEELSILPFDMDNEVTKSLLAYNWPGNIRELKNSILWAITVADKEITRYDLPEEIINEHIQENPLTLKNKFSQVEEQTIRDTLIQANYNISEAAKILGVSRPTLYRKLEAYGLHKSGS